MVGFMFYPVAPAVLIEISARKAETVTLTEYFSTINAVRLESGRSYAQRRAGRGSGNRLCNEGKRR